MTTAQLITLDLFVAVLTTAAWIGAGAAATAGRTRMALALAGGAVAATLARVGLVVALAGRGWWFAQEKVTLSLPLLGVAGLLTAALAVRRVSTVVALFTCGYASAAGLVVTLLVGYPVTWPVALLTVALVGLAALLTWRVVSPAATPGLRAAAAATLAVGLAGVGFAFVPTAAADTGGGPDLVARGDVPVSALRGPVAPETGAAVRRYTLTARTATITLSSGRQVPAWTFDGQAPGPPITATEGDLVEVTLRNADIASGVTLHWHGYDVPSGEDGVPGLTQDAVRPGQEFTYRFQARQVGTYWYHTHEVSDRGVKMGLFGLFVVTPRGAPTSGLDLTLPVHTFGGVTVLGNSDGLVERSVAPGTPVRLRLVNTDNVPHRFTLAGTPYRLVAIDGTDLNGPGELTRVALRLPAGGRYDLAFSMPSDPVSLLVDDDRARGLWFGSAGTVADTAGWPELDLTRYGTPGPSSLAGARFDRSFTLVLDRGLTLSGYKYTVNGHAFPSIPTLAVREGEIVRMTVVNRSRDTHPWHLHGHHVLVLALDGHPPTGSPLWMDTFDVRPGEVWEVAFRASNPGLWMNHCHNLSHADQGMALHLAYDGIATPFHGAHGG